MLDRPDNPGSQREAALLSWIQQFAPYGVVTLDQAFQVQSWNHWMEVHSGKPLAEVTGKKLFTLFPDLHERKLTIHFERALQGESSVLSTSLHRYLLPLPSPFREAGLTQMLQTARIAPLYSHEKICGIVLVIEDVTQRESQAEALERQHRRDELLAWALAHLLKTEEPRKAVRQLFFKIAEQLDLDTFLFYLRDGETARLNLQEVGGVPTESDQQFLICPFVTALAGQSDKIVVAQSVQSLAEPEYAALQKVGVGAAILLPLVANGRNLGLLCFATCIRETIAPHESDLLKTIAQYLAAALDRENTSRQLHLAKEQLSGHAQLLEKRVQERTASLQETIAELETFSYTIAHDLKAPARVISGYCEVLLEDFAPGLPPDTQQLINKIARTSERMEILTHDLLEFNKVSRQEIVLGSVDIGSVIEDLAALRVPGVREAITVSPPLHPVRAHRGLLQHVFSNLIDNAIKFVQPHTPPRITICTEVVPCNSPNTRPRSLVFSSTEVSPSKGAARETEKLPEHIRVWVQDQGIGIPPEVHQKIFGIFERGVSSNVYEGTGIGLAIVARAMQRMGGTCGVESEPGKGSRFWLEFPPG